MDGPQPNFENLHESGSAFRSIPVEHLDYAYIRLNQNVKELEKILRVLRSGEEGHYPDLIQFCERRIETLAPQSKVLRKDKPPASMFDVGKEEWQQLNTDMTDWAAEMSKESFSSPGLSIDDDNLPPIRKPVTVNTQGKKSKTEETLWGKPSPERIKSSDYQSWEKFDADAAAEGLDVKKNGAEKHKQPKVTAAALTSFIDTEGMTDKERVTVANKEKDKGNEAFKAGDFDEAVQYYTRSISVIPSAPSYNNRSLARIKLGQFIGALEDCTKVLGLEPENIKALLRRGTARKALREFTGAKEDLEAVLKAEPYNKQAMDLLADILAKEAIEKNGPQPRKEPVKESNPKGRRMDIQEVDGDSESESEEEDGKGQGSAVNGKGAADASMSMGDDGKQSEPDLKDKDQASPQSDVGSAMQNQDDGGSVTTTTPPSSDNGSGSPVPIVTPLPSNNATALQNQDSSGSVTTTTPLPANVVPALPLPDDIIILKDSGNYFFKAGQYGEAMEKYSLAIAKVLPEKESFSAALATLYSNRAACNSKTGHLKEVISDCDAALGIQPYSVKSMLRRGTAYEALEKYGLAYIDYQGALKLDTVNQMAVGGTARMIRILSDRDGSRWRENLPPSPTILGLPLPPPSLTTMAPSNASVPSVTSTTNASSKPALATSVQPDQSPAQPQPKVKDQEVKGQGVKGQGAKGQDAKVEGAKLKQTEKSFETRRPNSKPMGGEVKAKEGSGFRGTGDPTPTIDPNLSKEANFQKLKSEGNALVQQGEYTAAIMYYTACIAVDSTLAVSYTNRALCYIKLLKGHEAEADCTKALELNDANVKALYRRALARKMLHKFSESARDLTSLLKIEPGNASAKKEIEQVKELWRQELKNNQQKTAEKSKQNTQPPQAKPAEVKPAEVKPAEVEPAEVESAEVEPAEVESAEVESAEVKAAEVKAAEVKAAEVKPAEVKPAEVKPAEVKPAEVKPAEVKPAEVKPAEVKPAEVKPAVVKPVEVKSDGPGRKKRRGKRMQIQEIEGSSEDDNDADKPKPTNAEKITTKEKKTSKTPRDKGSQKGGKNPGAGDPKISVPKLSKVTAYEFIQAWTSLKRHRSMHAYAELLKQVSPDELPEVLTNKMDGDMLANIIKAVCENIVESDGDLSYGLLANLPKVERFQTVGLFLSTSDKKRLRNSLKKLSSMKTDAYTDSDIETLRQLYGL